MSPGTADVSAPARLAGPGEGITADELALAARNHAMPLEALRCDITPPGLHYLLIHYDIPAVDPDAWRLRVDGLVDRPLSLTLDQLYGMPATTHRVTMECAGNGRARMLPRPISQPWLTGAVGTAEWTGVPLRALLDAAGIDPTTRDIVFTGADHGIEHGVEQDYQRGLPLAEARRPEMLVAYAMNGQPLPPQHGYPARLVAPGWYGMAHVKWLTAVTAVDRAFDGFQQDAYRIRREAGEPGDPVTRILPRALLQPPGFPDFMTRDRVVRPGEVALAGRAWSGRAPVARVEISTDAGASWRAAELEPPGRHPWAWRRFTAAWTATPGRYVLSARATDADGSAQPVEQRWNRGGFTNNLVQRIPVTCVD